MAPKPKYSKRPCIICQQYQRCALSTFCIYILSLIALCIYYKDTTLQISVSESSLPSFLVPTVSISDNGHVNMTAVALELESNLHETQKEHKNTKLELNLKKRAVDQLQKQLEQNKENVKKSTKDLIEQIKKRDDVITAHQNNIIGLRSKITNLSAEHDTKHKATVENYESRVKHYEQKIQQYQRRVDELQTMVRHHTRTETTEEPTPSSKQETKAKEEGNREKSEPKDMEQKAKEWQQRQREKDDREEKERQKREREEAETKEKEEKLKEEKVEEQKLKNKETETENKSKESKESKKETEPNKNIKDNNDDNNEAPQPKQVSFVKISKRAKKEAMNEMNSNHTVAITKPNVIAMETPRPKSKGPLKAPPKSLANSVSVNSREIVRVIWILWFQGWDKAPIIPEVALKSWMHFNSVAHQPNGWQVIPLSHSNLPMYIPNYAQYRKLLEKGKYSMQSLSDIIRITLLRKYGGVWVDATVFCTKPLNQWLFQRVNKNGFFAFDRPHNSRIFSSWFLSSLFFDQSYIINSLYEKVMDYWRSHSKADGYFWFHKIATDLYKNNAEFQKEYDAVVKWSADEPHVLQRGKGGLPGIPKQQSIIDKIDEESLPMFKLALSEKWKVKVTDKAMFSNSNLGHLWEKYSSVIRVDSRPLITRANVTKMVKSKMS